MNEGHGPVGALARLAVDHLGLCGSQGLERRRKVIGDEADVMHAFAPLIQEPRDTTVGVDRLDELDPRGGVRARGQEAEPHPLRREDGRILLGCQVEELAVASERRLDRAHDDRDVMDRPDPGPASRSMLSPHTSHGVGDLAERHRRLDAGTDPRQHVLGAGRRAFEVGDGGVGRRLVPGSREGLGSARPGSPRARDRCAAAPVASSTPSSAYALTPTMTRSPASTASCCS